MNAAGAPSEGESLVNDDPRVHPLVEVDRKIVEQMLAPVVGGAAVRRIVCMDGTADERPYRWNGDSLILGDDRTWRRVLIRIR